MSIAPLLKDASPMDLACFSYTKLHHLRIMWILCSNLRTQSMQPLLQELEQALAMPEIAEMEKQRLLTEARELTPDVYNPEECLLFVGSLINSPDTFHQELAGALIKSCKLMESDFLYLSIQPSAEIQVLLQDNLNQLMAQVQMWQQQPSLPLSTMYHTWATQGL